MRCRPPILFTAAYGAGLATGLLHFGGPVSAAMLLAGSLLLPGGLPRLLALSALLGQSSAELARMADRGSCPARLPDGTVRLRVRLVEPADSGGGRLAVQPIAAGCTGPVPARWPRGRTIPAGREVSVTGRWMPRPGPAGRHGGTLVVSRAGQEGGAPDFPARIRTYLTRTSGALYGSRAPMVDALVLGRRGGIDPALQDRFAQSGLVHLLSISGFHVGLITAWVFLACRLARVGRNRALVVAALASGGYVAFLGWPAPATRAAALAALAALCRLRQRHVQSDALLAATCLCVLLIDPWAIADLGGWLSAAALWGATRFTRWSDRALGPTMWWRTLAASVGASLATAPITGLALGTVSVVGVLLNFIAIPLAAVAVPGVLASLLTHGWWPGGAQALAGGAGLALHLLELAAVAGAAVPGGHFLMEPGDVPAMLPWLAGLAAALWCVGTRNTGREAGRRLGWITATVLWLGLARGIAAASGDGDDVLALHFLDVGQGDAATIRTPAGRWVVIDAGPAGAGRQGDAGRRVVAPFLLHRGARRLAAAVVSHAHADHLGGLPSVLEATPPAVVLEPGALVADPLYIGFLERLAATTVPWHPTRAGERFELDGVGFTVLHPASGWAGAGEDLNEDSLVLLIQYGGFRALFAGDAGFPAEVALRGRVGAVDLLKVGHHGSRGSTGDAWLAETRPAVAVISVGRNDYGHPSPETLMRLAAHGVAIRRTDRDGPVTVTTDGKRMVVRWGGEQIEYPLTAERQTPGGER